MVALKTKTRTACAIAGLNSDRLNEATNAKTYHCAPATKPGTAHVFDLDDVVALKVYSELMQDGMTAREAGRNACELRAAMEKNPDAEKVVRVQLGGGHDVWVNWKQFDPDSEEIDELRTRNWCVFPLTKLRNVVASKIQEATKVA